MTSIWWRRRVNIGKKGKWEKVSTMADAAWLGFNGNRREIFRLRSIGKISTLSHIDTLDVKLLSLKNISNKLLEAVRAVMWYLLTMNQHFSGEAWL